MNAIECVAPIRKVPDPLGDVTALAGKLSALSRGGSVTNRRLPSFEETISAVTAAYLDAAGNKTAGAVAQRTTLATR